MVGEEAAGEEGVAAVVEREIGQGRAAGAGDEEDQAGAVAVLGGAIGALGPHGAAEELDDGVERAGHADAIDGAAGDRN